jgi:hypothetical protein
LVIACSWTPFHWRDLRCFSFKKIFTYNFLTSFYIKTTNSFIPTRWI